MKKNGKILVVDDNEEILIALRFLLKDYFEVVDCEKNPNLIPSIVERSLYDVYILDMNFRGGRYTGNEGIFWMNRILDIHPAAVIIFITAYGDVDLAVKAIKEGAADFILKPWSDDKFVSTVLSAYKLSQSRCEEGRSGTGETPDRDIPGKHEQAIIGSSHPIKKVFRQVQKVAATDASVLLTGENGTGKELFAREIHRCSARAAEVFVSVDMGSLSGSLFESELFGHKKGSFTDAAEDRPGRFELADRGTIFLDEIGNLPLPLQPKLLSVLQNRQVTRVGSNKAVNVDIRLITATNMPLEKMVREGNFREDLLYRLNTIVINIPPLRERGGDIAGLFRYFLDHYSRRYNKGKLEAGNEILAALQSYHWPGNVRELEHAVEKAVIMSEDGRIRPEDFAFAHSGIAGPEIDENLNLETNESYIIRKAIKKCGGNLSQAARVLGVTRKTLYNKIEKYGI
jgi:DNA-binding NtrC family response regulator